MGALEALNGIILFGLTTAFFFDVIQAVRPLDRSRSWRRKIVRALRRSTCLHTDEFA